MPVIAVVNRKGGSGKSTLATHVAAWLSLRGDKVMLGDVDKQRSTVPWLRRRSEQSIAGEPLQGWVADPRNVLRPPVGVRHVVLDTPGGLRGFDLGRVLMYADIVLLPLCDSLFDRDSAAGCIEELRAHPRVSGGRVQLGVVGMRLDWSRSGETSLREWAERQGVNVVAAVRDSRAYVHAAERGLTVIDLPVEQTRTERGEWQQLFDWLDAAMGAIPAPASPRPIHTGPTLAPVAAPAAVEGASASAGAAPSAPFAPPAVSTVSAPSPASPRPAAPARAATDPAAIAAAQVPITLIQTRSRSAQALDELRSWLGRLLPQTHATRGTRIRTGP